MSRSVERLGEVSRAVRTCDFRCNGFSFIPGENTKDGKPTFIILCSEGLPGGCKGPNKDQLQEIDQAVGKRLKAKRRMPYPYPRFEVE